MICDRCQTTLTDHIWQCGISTLCPKCFDKRDEDIKPIERKVEKTSHPLDAWMR